MGYRTVTVDVDVDDVINDIDDQDLIDELKRRGYIVNKDTEYRGFDREDLNLLIEIIDQTPETIYTRRVRDKLMRDRFG
jgi:hypothetical protein